MSMTLSGADAGNYSLTQPPALQPISLAKELNVTGAVAADKVYDGTTHATISGAAVEGKVAGDVVNLSNGTTGEFAQASVGTGIEVNTSMSLSGADAANYTLVQPY